MKTTFTAANDGKELYTRRWNPEGEPKAALLIVHGMGEHSARYSEFARFLTDNNYAVFAYDHRGHGYTTPDQDQKGIVRAQNAYQQMADDIVTVQQTIRTIYPDLPLFLFAHSMGSFLTMRALQTPNTIPAPEGVIYSGTSGAVSPLLPLGIFFSSLLRKIFGDDYKSELLRNMIFLPYNNAFKPTRTRHDWISRDKKAIDRYVADPNCGFTPSASFLNEFFKGLRRTQRHEPFSGPYSYPVLIIAGSEDPISKPLDGISKLTEKLKSSGIESLDRKIYEGGRHEMLSELNKEDVMKDIHHWLDETMEKVKSKALAS